MPLAACLLSWALLLPGDPPAPTGQVLTPIALLPADPADPTSRDEVWAAGANFKVRFGGRSDPGAEFFPVLGSGFARNLPLRLRLAAPHRGAAPPAPTIRGRLIEYHHERLTEIYEVTAGALQQRFSLAAASALDARGVLRIGVDTELEAADREAVHKPLVFRNGARPIASYGRAWAIDAAGRRIALGTSYRRKIGGGGGTIGVHLPDGWLRSAHWPVLIDPPLLNILVDASSNPADGLAVEYDAAAGRYLVAFSRRSAATDSDLLCLLCSADFSQVATVYADLSTSWSSAEPAVAASAGARRWGVLFTRRFPLNPPLQLVRGIFHPIASTTPTTGFFYFTLTSPEHESHPDLGATTAAGTAMIAVFERDAPGSLGSHTRTVAGILDATLPGRASAPVLVPAFEIDQPPGNQLDQEQVRVNQRARDDADPWMIVYREKDRAIAGDDWDLATWRADRGGNLHSALQIDISPAQGDDAVNPDVAGMLTEFLVVSSSPRGVSPAGGVLVHHLDYSAGTPPAATLPGIFAIPTGAAVHTSITCDTTSLAQWCIAWSTTSPGANEARWARLTRLGRILSSARFYTHPSEPLSRLALCQRAEDPQTPRITFSLFQAIERPDHPILIHQVTSGARAQLYGAPCGTSRMGTLNEPFRANRHFAARVWGGLPGAPLLCLVGLSRTTWAGLPLPLDLAFLGAPACSLYASGEMITAAALDASGEFILPLPLNLPRGIFEVYLQAWVFEPSASPLALAFTRGLHLLIR